MLSIVPATAEATKTRLLDAAQAEFAAHGIAGARTGRIAAAAGVNEALLFRYFGGKQSLFEQVYDALVVQTIDDVSLDAARLPEYAGALFDYYQAHAEVLRISIWAALERPGDASRTVSAATADKTGAIQRAQRSGAVATHVPAGELLALIVQLSTSGASVAASLGPGVDPVLRRASVVAAVCLLVDPNSKQTRRRRR